MQKKQGTIKRSEISKLVHWLRSEPYRHNLEKLQQQAAPSLVLRLHLQLFPFDHDDIYQQAVEVGRYDCFVY